MSRGALTVNPLVINGNLWLYTAVVIFHAVDKLYWIIQSLVIPTIYIIVPVELNPIPDGALSNAVTLNV